MDPNTFPTKGNLILAKNSLALSRQGFELMDKKKKHSDQRNDGPYRSGKGYPDTD